MTSDNPPVEQRDSPLAIISMVCGAVSLSGAGLFLGIPAIIFGIIALKKSPASRALSVAGIVTGTISTLLSLIVLGFFIWLITSDNLPDNVQPLPDYQTSQTSVKS